MEWSIEIAAGICLVTTLHHILFVTILLHVQKDAFVLVKQYLSTEFALMLLYVQVHYYYTYVL